jgi:hypothetical protein
VGRHSAPKVTFRNAAVVTAASAGLVMALTGTAGADPVLGNCADTPRSVNPDVRVCSDHGYDDGYDNDRGDYNRASDRLHAIVKVDPLLCVHVVIDPEGHRRLVGTRSCEHRTPVVVVPACPCPPGTAPAAVPCPNTPGSPVAPAAPATPIPVAPSSPVESGPTGETTPASSSSSSPVEEAPAPATVVGGPVVTH